MRNITRPYSYIAACDQSVWKSPAPYVLGAAGAIIVLIIAFFLILMVCYGKGSASYSEESNRESSDPNTEDHGEKNDTVLTISHCSDEIERKIINVIMAGNEKPTFIAKPTLSQGRST
uniref:Uncharacterized protein n=1 Tax=Picea sitchensis TaxID=3332 RepID=A9NME5_PICSI|nr:unknown [Picea sitchensis]